MAKGFKDSSGKFHPTGNNGTSSREKSIETSGMSMNNLETEIPVNVNEEFVDNVIDWVNNDQPMYRQMLAWATNLKRKQKHGVFDEEKALKGMEILADQEIKMYKDNVGIETFKEINKGSRIARQDKEALKEQLLERVLRAIEEGEV